MSILLRNTSDTRTWKSSFFFFRYYQIDAPSCSNRPDADSIWRQLLQLQPQSSLQHGRGGGKGVPSSFLSPPWLQHPLAWGRYICRSKCRGNLYQISFLLRQQELVSFGFTDMVANIGGYLGLFIGLSCLAFIDYLCQLAVKLSDVISHKKHWMWNISVEQW